MVHIRCKHGPHHHHRGDREKRALEDDLHVGSPVAIIDRLLAHRPDAFHFDVATATPNRVRIHQEKRTGPRTASGVDENIRLFLAHVFDQLHQRLAFGFIFRVLVEAVEFEHVDALIAEEIEAHFAEPCEVGRIGQAESQVFNRIGQVVLLRRCKSDLSATPPALRGHPDPQFGAMLFGDLFHDSPLVWVTLGVELPDIRGRAGHIVPRIVEHKQLHRHPALDGQFVVEGLDALKSFGLIGFLRSFGMEDVIPRIVVQDLMIGM